MRQWSWAWRRLIGEICPRNKSGRGHGGGEMENMPKKQKRRGYGEGKFRNMPKKQEWSWVWKGKY